MRPETRRALIVSLLPLACCLVFALLVAKVTGIHFSFLFLVLLAIFGAAYLAGDKKRQEEARLDAMRRQRAERALRQMESAGAEKSAAAFAETEESKDEEQP